MPLDQPLFVVRDQPGLKSHAEIFDRAERVEKWRLWVHGKGRGSADESVQVLKEVYERIQAYLTPRADTPFIATHLATY